MRGIRRRSGVGLGWRSDTKGSEWEVVNKRQWSVRNIGLIRRSGEHQSEEEREEKGGIIALTLLQNGYTCHKVAAQTHVSNSTASRPYSAISHAFPRQCAGHPANFLLKAKSPLFARPHLEQLVLPLNSKKL